MSDNNISRKDFLKVLGVGAAGALVMNSCKDRNDSSSPLVFSEDANMGEMTYRTNRHSKDKVSILGFGCMRFQTIPDPNSANTILLTKRWLTSKWTMQWNMASIISTPLRPIAEAHRKE